MSHSVNAHAQRIGLNCALSTPFTANSEIDHGRMVAHARWVIDNGCDGITLFGTTGEGASIGLGDRREVLGSFAAAGFDLPSQVIVGVAAATVDDAVAQVGMAYDMNCRGILLAPPFYFGNATDDGLFQFFSAVFQSLGDARRDIILYHIPSMTRNTISIDLTRRLMNAFPGVIIGVKDSNGNWPETERRLQELPELQILVGDERQLARAVRNGGAGSICGLANIAPDILRPLANEGRDDPRVTVMVDAILGHVFMSAVKAMIGEHLADPAWRNMRAPLQAMSDADTKILAEQIAQARNRTAA